MSYAYYRMPYADSYTVVRSESKDRLLRNYEQIGHDTGFVIAPFNNDVYTPIVIIAPDSVEQHTLPQGDVPQRHATATSTNISDGYEATFERFHNAICNGQFLKLVLSRSKEAELNTDDYEELFLEACRRYPRLMIMLVSTKVTGTWLVASPEILLTGDGAWWRTMALAGTMPYMDGYQEWSEKNQQEQRFVEAYIEDRLSDFSLEILKDGPTTKRAGNLVHLCTDFRFHIAPGCYIGELLASLHPTPAVCGIPKMKAREFIIENEQNERSYYSGFMGPVGINGETHLYVSLRCAKLEQGKATLYAGGGIMPESTLASEWDETEHKMQTIGNVLK